MREDGWEQFLTVTKIKLGDIVGHTSLVIDGVDIKPDKAAPTACQTATSAVRYWRL